MKFALIDPVLQQWADENSLVIDTQYKDIEVRSVTLTSGSGARCQIWLDEPTDQKITVNACEYPRRQAKWTGRIDELRQCLNKALNFIRGVIG